jgi:predicted AAA+ superfamily ATPase
MEGSSDEEPSEGNPQIRFREGGIETMHGIRIVRHKKGNLETEFKAEPKQRSLFLYSTSAKKMGDRNPLILRGARQVGKTTTVDMFAKDFDLYISLDLETP